MTNYTPITLPDDPIEALKEIGGYLATLRMDEERTVSDPDDKENPFGYWQTPEWLNGLHEIRQECRRIVQSAPSVLTPIAYRLPWTHYLNGDPKWNFAEIRAVNFDDKGNPRSWAIREGGCCLSKDLEGFEIEPTNSEKTDEFFVRTRFDSPEEAYECAEKYFTKGKK